MSNSRLELHAREASDFATLRALRAALERRGERPELSTAPGLRPDVDDWPEPGCVVGAVPGLLRVSVAGPIELGDQNPPPSAIIVDEIDPPWGIAPPELAAADLVFVPGPFMAELVPFRGRASNELIACGIARLDELVVDPTGSRIRARAELYLPPEAELVLFILTSDASGPFARLMSDEIARLPASGLTVLAVPSAPASSGISALLELAAHTPGLALAERLDPRRALAASDVVVSDCASQLYEAAALGRGTVLLEGSTDGAGRVGILDPKLEVGPRVGKPESLAAGVRSALPGSSWSRQYADARTRCRTELLLTDGSAADRMAEALCAHLAALESRALESRALEAEISTRSAPLARRDRAEQSGGESLLEGIEAQLAFGDTEGARERLVDLLEHRPSPAGYRLLASIHRKAGDTSAALGAIGSAEELSKRETAEALCERGRVLVDANQIEGARRAFDEALRLAPELVDPLVGLGSLAVHDVDAPAAEECFRRAIEKEKSPRTLTGLGLALLQAGRAREALLHLEEALDMQADCISAVYGVVQAGFQTGELALAERRVRAFVELHSGNLDLIFTLAGLRCQLGDRAGSLEMIGRIELFEPQYPGLEELRRKLDS